MPPNGIAAATIHHRDPVTEYHPGGYYRRAVGADPIVGYAAHCAIVGEPIALTTEPTKRRPKE
jgi:hypothetical protein